MEYLLPHPSPQCVMLTVGGGGSGSGSIKELPSRRRTRVMDTSSRLIRHSTGRMVPSWLLRRQDQRKKPVRDRGRYPAGRACPPLPPQTLFRPEGKHDALNSTRLRAWHRPIVQGSLLHASPDHEVDQGGLRACRRAVILPTSERGFFKPPKGHQG
jgi:hypothetical protein